MPLTIESVTIPFTEVGRVEKLESDLETMQQDLTNTRDKAGELKVAFEQALREKEEMRKERDMAHEALAKSVIVARDLKAQLDKLTAPPTTPQKVTRAYLGRWAGFTIEHSKKPPSPTESAYARKAMDWGKSMGLDMFRIFLNPMETRGMSAMAADNPENFIAYGRKIGLRWMADTMDTITGLIPTNDALKAYCDYLIAMGCEGFYINDADRVALPFEQLKTITGRLRTVAPTMPIFVSLLGSANVDLYKSVADYVEIQTFGTLSELATFLKRGAIPCIDLRAKLTATELRARVEVILRFPPNAFFFYADLATDYEQMPDDEDAVVREFVAKWKAIA